MKKLLCISLLLSYFSCKTFSQTSLIDSLQPLLEQATGPIEEVDLWLGLCRAYLFDGDIIAAQKAAENARTLSRNHQYELGEGVALNFLNQASHDYEAGHLFTLQALEIAKKIDSDALLVLSRYHEAEYYVYTKNDYQQGIDILLGTLDTITQEIPDKHLGNAHKVLGLAYIIGGQKEKGTLHFDKAIYHFKRVKSHPFIDPDLGRPSAMDADQGIQNLGQIFVYLSREYHQQGQTELALEYLADAQKIFKSIGSLDHLGWTFEETASIYRDIGKIGLSIDLYREALTIYQQSGNSLSLMEIYRSLGNLYRHMKDWELAEKYLEESLRYTVEFRDSLGRGYLKKALGEIALYRGNKEKARNLFEEALEINFQLKDSTQRAQLLINLAQVLTESQGSEQKAEELYREALRLNRKFKNHAYLSSNLSDFAQYFIQKSQGDSAWVYARRAEESVQSYGTLGQRINLQGLLSRLYEHEGEYKMALEHHKVYLSLYDSLYTNDAQAKLKQEQVRQEVVQYKNAKAQVEREKTLLQTQNTLYLALAFSLFALLTIGGYLFFRLRKTQERLKGQHSRLVDLNATKDKFFAIIAHDIRSPILALEGVGEQIEYYLEKKRADKLDRLAGKIDKTARRLSTLLDNLLNWALLQQGVIPYYPHPLHLKEHCIQVIEMFQANAAVKEIGLHCEVDEDLTVYADESSLSTILRNLLSNAIKFTPGKGQVIIRAYEDERKELRIEVEDNGVGISPEKLEQLFSIHPSTDKGTSGEKGTGLGLILVKELAELNQGKLIIYTQKDEGSVFSVLLPREAPV